MVNCRNCGAEIPQGASYCAKCGTPVSRVRELWLANWGERFVAWLIDAIIIGIFTQIVRTVAAAAWPTYVLLPGVPDFIPFTNFGLGSLFFFVYWMLMEGLYGQSLGKMAMRIRITRLDGSSIDMGRAALESFGKAFILVIDLIVGLILYGKRRQRLFSHLAGTIVIRTR